MTEVSQTNTDALPKSTADGTERLTLEWLNLEFASNCNLRCKWCSLDHTKPTSFMSRELLGKVLDEVVRDPGIVLDRIELHNAGETLLHPDIPGMFEEIAARKADLPTINLLTNAGALNEKRTRAVLDSGAIDEIRFSVDGGTAEEFEELRRPARWKNIQRNIHAFLDANEAMETPLKTGAICILGPDKELSTSWMEPEFQELFGRIDNVALRHPHNWDGSVSLEINDGDYARHAEKMAAMGKVCYFLTKDMVVLPNGDVTVCCADLNSRGVVGNVSLQSLRQVFHSPGRLDMLRKFAAGKKNEIDLCKDCTGYYQ